MNKLLQKTRRQMLTKPPALRAEIQRLVTAGKTFATPFAAGDARAPEGIALGIASILGQAAEGLGDDFCRSPSLPSVLSPAAMVLLCDHLHQAERAGAGKVKPALFEQCTSALMAKVLLMLGVTSDKINETAAQAPASDLAGLDAAQALLTGSTRTVLHSQAATQRGT